MGTELTTLLQSLRSTPGVLLATDDGTLFNGEIKNVESSIVTFEGKIEAPPRTDAIVVGRTINIPIAHFAWVVRG